MRYPRAPRPTILPGTSLAKRRRLSTLFSGPWLATESPEVSDTWYDCESPAHSTDPAKLGQDGFGVHTFRFVNNDGDTKLIKWHWKTKQGKASLVWDEAQHVAGKNADFHRQDLFDAIESGNFPEWELNVQIINEDQALAFGFDVLDPTKIIPEEFAPLHKVGVMRLDANPVNYFAETEQIMVSFGPILAYLMTNADGTIVSTRPYRARH